MVSRLGRDYWLLWASSTVSNLGDGIRVTALPLLTVGVTRDPVAVAAVTAASFAPWLLFALVGGALADRVDRRRLIVVGQLLRAGALALFAAIVAGGAVPLAAIYTIAAVVGLGEVVVDSAVPAAVPRVAGDRLDEANSRMTAAQFLTNEVVGGPLGGLLFVTAAVIPFVVDAATFAVGAVLVLLIPRGLGGGGAAVDGAAPNGRPGLLSDIAEGFGYLRRQPVLFGLAVAVGLSNLADTATRALLVLLLIDVLDEPGVVYGFVLAVAAIGGFIGSMVAVRVIDTVGRRSTLIAVFVLLGSGLAAIGLAPNVFVVGAGSFVSMVAVALFNVAAQSVRQRLTPDRLLGRVIASGRVFAYGAVPIGTLGGGLLARLVGIRPTITLAASLSLGTSVVVARATAGHDLEWR